MFSADMAQTLDYTETEEIPADAQAYRDALTISEGYKLQWLGNWGWQMLSDDEEIGFRLSDRTFGDYDQTPNGQVITDIDHHTSNVISKTIEHVICEKGRARILDIGCGPLNQAACQIARRYGDKVDVKAIDIVDSSMKHSVPNLERKTGDALSLPLKVAQLILHIQYSLFRIYQFLKELKCWKRH